MTITIPPAMKNWKTTVFGLASAIVAIVQASHEPSLAAMLKDPKVQMSILVALLGLFAKDSNVTGGTKGQPSTPQALSDANQAPAKGTAAPVGPEAIPPVKVSNG